MRPSHRAAQPEGGENPRTCTVQASLREWLIRGILIIAAPLVLFFSTEGALRLFGYGYPTTFFIAPNHGGSYLTNERFAWRFFSKTTALKPFPGWLPANKPPGTIRLCILGESAAMGTPDPAFAFGRVLEVELRRAFPAPRFEVINAAMRGIDSHIVRLIAQECARHRVDYFIVYMGNNEVIGLHGPEPASPGWTQSLVLIRLSQWLKTTKTGQLIENLLGHAATKPPVQDMAYFRAHSLRASDWRREKNRQNLEANLEDILRAATRSGAKVLLATVGANLKDFPPLESLHRADLSASDQVRWEAAYQQGIELAAQGQYRQAIEKYEQAAALDDQFAELHFRMAECLLAIGNAPEAKQHYSLARDWDALQFRADSRMNGVLRQVATRHLNDGVILVDAEAAFSSCPFSANGIPGDTLFCDHVHPTFAGYYVLAGAFRAPLFSMLEPRLGKPAERKPPALRECARALAYTPYDDINAIAAAVRMKAGPPFLDQLDHARRQAAAESFSRRALAEFGRPQADQCLNMYRAALAERPDDWVLHYNFGVLCQELRLFSDAADQFAFVAHRFPPLDRFLAQSASARKMALNCRPNLGGPAPQTAGR